MNRRSSFEQLGTTGRDGGHVPPRGTVGGGGGQRFHLSQNSVYDIHRDPVGPAWRRFKAFRCVPTVFVCSVNYPRASLRFAFDRKVPMVS